MRIEIKLSINVSHEGLGLIEELANKYPKDVYDVVVVTGATDATAPQPAARRVSRSNGTRKRGSLPGGGGRQFALNQVLELQSEGLQLKYLESQFVRYGYSKNNASCRLSELYVKHWNPEGPLIEQGADGRYYPTARGLKVRKAPDPPSKR